MKKLLGVLLIACAICLQLFGCAFLIETIDKQSVQSVVAIVFACPFFGFFFWCHGLALVDNAPPSQVIDEQIERLTEAVASFFGSLFGCLGCLLVIALGVGLCSWLGPTGIIIVLLVLILLKK